MARNKFTFCSRRILRFMIGLPSRREGVDWSHFHLQMLQNAYGRCTRDDRRQNAIFAQSCRKFRQSQQMTSTKQAFENRICIFFCPAIWREDSLTSTFHHSIIFESSSDTKISFRLHYSKTPIAPGEAEQIHNQGHNKDTKREKTQWCKAKANYKPSGLQRYRWQF